MNKSNPFIANWVPSTLNIDRKGIHKLCGFHTILRTVIAVGSYIQLFGAC